MARSKTKPKHQSHDNPQIQHHSQPALASKVVSEARDQSPIEPSRPRKVEERQQRPRSPEIHAPNRKRKRERQEPLPPAKRSSMSPNHMFGFEAIRELGAIWKGHKCHKCSNPLIRHDFNLNKHVVNAPCFSVRSSKKPVDIVVLCSIQCSAVSCSAVTCFACGKALKPVKQRNRHVPLPQNSAPICGCGESRIAAICMLLMVLDAEEAIKEDEIIEERTHFTRSRAKSLDSRTKPPAGEKPTVPPHALSKGYGPPPEWYSFAPVPSDYHGSYPSASPDTSDPWGPHGGSKHIELASKTFGQSKPGKSNNASIKQIQAGLQDLHSEVSSLAKMGLPELPPLYSKAKLEKRSLGVGYADEDDMGYPLWQDSDKEAAMESQYMLALSQEYSAVTSGWPSLSSPQGQLPSPHFGRKGRDELVRAKNRKSDFHNQRELAINLIAELMPTRRDDEGTTNELDWDPPEVLLQLLRSSSIRTIMADSLCDEVLNFDSDAIGLRTAVTNCLTSWSTHSRLKVLVTEDRSTSKMHLHDAIFGIEPSENLSFGEATHTSLFKTMSSLVVGCETTLKAAETLPSAYKRSKQLLDFCASVLGVFNILKDVATDPVLEEKPISPWSRLCKEDRVTYVEDEDILKGHHYEKEATRMKFSSGPRFKRLVEDVAILKTSLPDGIFVKLAYSRPDVMKFIIIGPEHTPYAGGLFEFHLFCPASYPRSPPLVWFPMAASAQLRLNPNLHGHGMVCISLIGTWSGIGGENWQPGKSTLLQLLVSMQSMIFCAEPYYNEPGFGGHEDKATSERYTNAVQALTIRLGLLHWLSDDTWKQSLWRDFIGTYMESQADSLVAVARSWGATNSHVTKYSGFREPMHVAGFYDPHGWSSEVPSLDAEIPVEVLQQIRSRMPKSPAKTQNLAQDLHDALVEFKKKLPGQKNGL